ncbi:1753_t:CDS:2 [Diversispora eburnea]|uniref:1753_t:CDS:1 n=1 Tax=Diversispora eburnea TaxID=1213867 RepID=A0A9N9BQQ0_9GLOM|nr:1753_t:CDS:2 [Diversispora eburnea]
MANKQSKIDELVSQDAVSSLNEQISKLVAENDKLRRENAEIPGLRREKDLLMARIIELERLTKESAENEKRSRIENSELKSRVTKSERDIEEIKQKKITPNISELHADISIESDTSASDITDNATNSDEHQEEMKSQVSNSHSTELSVCIKPKSSEDKEMDDFLVERHNEQILNEIKERNREKNLQCESPTENSPKKDTYISNIKSSIYPEQKKEQGLIQEISTSIKDQNNITEISQNNVRQNHVTEIASDQDIICLYQNACDAEKDAIKANQEEILC